ncbi:MAG: carbamoyl-phosphate synthase large subunit [Thermoplasmata archaeon]
MPSDLRRIMVIGSGPIAIGQAAEFDYSGSQAVRSLKEEGYETILVNSNPATIQTEVDMADVVYIEPLTTEFLKKIIEKERPNGLLAGMGGQTALNLCSELAEHGILEKYGVQILGTSLEAIRISEDRDAFRSLMKSIGEPIPESEACKSVEGALKIAEKLGFPLIVRPAYTLGGTGSGIARDEDELKRTVALGIHYSRIKQVLVEEGVFGWKEFEYEVMRDSADNCIIVCNMENLDPMGFHTGESIVVAPAQTLTDVEHQRLRTSAIKIIRGLKIEGGCNIQFAVNQRTGDYRVIEVNPRVSRSSALASKATGYPIAKVAAKIALGMTLDRIRNPVTSRTYAAFEPTLDYVVTKIPRWPFDKFQSADPYIGTQMKSTGEVMAIGRCLEESLFKAVRSLDIGMSRFGRLDFDSKVLEEELRNPTDKRLFAIAEALRRRIPTRRIADLTKWDEFFIEKIKNIVKMEARLRRGDVKAIRGAKKMGFGDATIARMSGLSEDEVRKRRCEVTYKMVDTCGGEFQAATPYFYSTFDSECELTSLTKRKVLVIGSGPIRIGQGIEFDTCCVQAIMALKEEGITAIIINNNPETVSTDYDISDRLFFEPLTLEDVANVIEKEKPDGVILQFGGQTSINLALPLENYLKKSGLKTKILGTSPKSINISEDRELFRTLMRRLGIMQPEAATGFSFDEVRDIAREMGYPVLVRPSYVLGGRGMEIVHDEAELRTFMKEAVKITRGHPVIVDKFLDDAIEIDVDAISDGKDVFISGVQEHIEEAGVHSGDAMCVLPPQTLSKGVQDEIVQLTGKICKALDVIGLVNLQLAVKDGLVHILEANLRASRSVPYVSKAIGVPLSKIATKVTVGRSLRELGYVGLARISGVAVKAPVFPFQKLKGVDSILGPEMKSTGEVMGIDKSAGKAFYKAIVAAGNNLSTQGSVYITVRDEDKPKIVPIARRLSNLGWKIYATRGTSSVLRTAGVEAKTVYRIRENKSPTAIGLMRDGMVDLVINTPSKESGPRRDGYMMRRLAIDLNISFVTRIEGARIIAEAAELVSREEVDVISLQRFHELQSADS